MFDGPLLTGPAGEIVGWLLGNAVLVTAVAVGVALMSRVLRRPELVHVLWSATLLKLFTPALLVVTIPVALVRANVTGPGLDAAQLAALADLQGGGGGPWWAGREAEILLGIQILGSLLVATVIWTRQRRWQELVAGGRDAEPALRARVASLAARLGLHQAPAVRVVDSVMSPAVVGPLFSPSMLVLPRTLLDALTASELDAVVVHELAHLKRRDPWIRRLEVAAVAVYWWNPVVHWARRHLHQWEEMSCDLAVLRVLPAHRKAYAHALIATLEHLKTGARPVPMLAHGLGSPHTWKERLHMIMLQDAAVPSRPARYLVWIFAAALVGLSPMVVGADLPTETEVVADGSAAETGKQYTGDPIDMQLKNADLRETLQSFATIAGLDLEIDPSVQGSVTVDLKKVPWDQALDEILKINGLAMQLEGDKARIVPRAATSSATGKTYGGDPISMSLKDADLKVVLESMAKISGLEMHVSPAVDGKVTVELKSVPWDQALDQLVAEHDLDMRIEGKLVHIAPRSDD